MPSSKKGKGAAPEEDECANCCVKGSTEKGRSGVALKPCPECDLTLYCGKPCQRAHWEAGHKHHCVTPKQRRVPQQASNPPAVNGVQASAPHTDELGPDECPICLDPLALGILVCTLPCTHAFHASCIAGLRAFGIMQACPLCRAELPPGPEKLFEEATRRYFGVKRRVDRGDEAWGALSKLMRGEMEEVIRMWRTSAEQGHAPALVNLAAVHFNGHGVNQDHGEAVKMYREAAEQGHAEAQSTLGSMYATGQGLKRNHVEAMRWFRKAAGQGLSAAQFELGVMFSNGEGVQKDHVEAAFWYREAAEQGHAGAQVNLGTMCANGQGLDQDHVEAVRWYREAAEQGHAKAQFNLGVMNFNGSCGKQQDFAESSRWFRKAAAQGYAGADKNATLAEDWLRRQLQAALPPAAPLRAAPSAALPPKGVQKCANCGIAKAVGGVTLKPCARCKAVVYCGKECQVVHWKSGGHRGVCRGTPLSSSPQSPEVSSNPAAAFPGSPTNVALFPTPPSSPALPNGDDAEEDGTPAASALRPVARQD